MDTIFFSCSEKVDLCSIKTFSWLNEAYPQYANNLFYSKSTDLNFTFDQKSPLEKQPE